jgi:hypothetical protein
LLASQDVYQLWKALNEAVAPGEDTRRLFQFPQSIMVISSRRSSASYRY